MTRSFWIINGAHLPVLSSLGLVRGFIYGASLHGW